MRKLVLLAIYSLIALHRLSAAPIVTSVSPTNGSIAGGNSVTITGSGFTATSNVDFGPRTALGFTILNDTTITATVPIGTVGTVDVRVTAMAITSPTTPDDFYTYKTVGWNGIIPTIQPDNLALFNTETNTFTTNINTSATSLTSVISPNGEFIYVANETPLGISVIDAATNIVVTTIPTTKTGAFDLITNPDGTRLYLSNNSGYVTVVDTTTHAVSDIAVQPNLGPISITPDGKTVFVSNFSGGFYPIDTATNALGPVIPTPLYPGKLSITPDGTKAFLPIFFSNEVLVYSLPSQTLINTISVSPSLGPYGSSILPNSQTLYVANIASNTVSAIDVGSEAVTATLSLSPPLPADAGTFWIASTPDSKKIYVINEVYDVVIPIDAATNVVGIPFGGIGGKFQDLVISPDPAPVAAFTAIPQVVGVPTPFDAAASLSPIGTIVTYAWDFGDGNTLTTASPTTTHTYIAAGNYNVTLTVTNSAGTSTTQVFSSGFMSNNGGSSAMRSKIIDALPVPPPINVIGFQKFCCFPSQTDIVNVLEWQPPIGFTPTAYNIYRDAALTQLVGVVPGAGPFIFVDPNRKKNVVYIYYIVSVNSIGALSVPVVVNVQPNTKGCNV